MTIDINESNPDELWIIQRGSKLQSVFFAIMGFLFQVLFLWAYWSFLDTSGPWAFFWLGLINSDFFPFTSLLFLFGGGCFLVAIKEGLLIEAWIIYKEITLNTPGIEKIWQLSRWSRKVEISRDQIRSLRIHKIPLDTLKLFNRYQLEIDYQKTDTSPLETSILYSADNESASAKITQLARKIQEILNLPANIDRKEAPRAPLVNEKRRKEK